MKAELDDELRQLARTTTYAHRLSGFQHLTDLLIDSADEEAKRLEGVRLTSCRSLRSFRLKRHFW